MNTTGDAMLAVRAMGDPHCAEFANRHQVARRHRTNQQRLFTARSSLWMDRAVNITADAVLQIIRAMSDPPRGCIKCTCSLTLNARVILKRNANAALLVVKVLMDSRCAECTYSQISKGVLVKQTQLPSSSSGTQASYVFIRQITPLSECGSSISKCSRSPG